MIGKSFLIRLAATAFVFLPAASAAAEPQAATLLAQAKRDSVAYGLVRSLTTDIGPRLAGSPAEAAARLWAVARLKSLGFADVHEEAFTIKGWERGEERAEIVAPARQPLQIVGFGRSVPTPPAGLTADIAYFSSFDSLKRAGSLAGQIVFLDGPKMIGGRAGPEQEGPWPRDVVAEASRHGALAVLMRSGGTGGHRFAHVRVLNYARDAAPLPAAGLSDADADQLARLAAGGRAVRIKLFLGSGALGDVFSGNVVGDIRGREKPDEIVLLGAHLDSWDLGTGALDDGVGVGIVTAAARLLSQMPQRPKRTIRVVLFGAEEVGLDGARAYAKAHTGELPRHRLAIEADFGAAPVWGFYTNVPDSMFAQMDRIATALRPLGVERGHNHASGGEDLTFIKQAGVPVVSLVPDGTHYFDYHHTADDTFDKIDPEALRQNVAAFALAAYLAAEE